MRQIDTIVLVRDIAESKAFYTGVIGLEVLHDWDAMVVFKNRLALHQLDLLQPRDLIGPSLSTASIGAGNVVIYIATRKIEEEFARLQARGIEIVHGIVQLPWQRLFRAKDINGYLLEIGEELDSEA